MVKMCGGKPIIVPTYPENSYTLRPEELEKTLQNNDIKVIILCDPSNPTGCVSSKNALVEIAKILEKYPDVAIISDEIYERLVYDNTEHTSFATIPNMFDRTITINGFSKSYSMTGYRIGYAAGPTNVIKAINKIQSQITSCASSIGQYAALKALSDENLEDWMASKINELKIKRDLAYNLLLQIPNIKCPKPTGAFYLLPDVSYYYGKTLPNSNNEKLLSAQQLCVELLKSEQVALVPGEAFGADNCIRISYAASENVILESMTRLKNFLLSLQ